MIKGLSQVRRLPRLGIIRLGIKAKSAKGTEYPKAVDYFVCPDEVKKIYGEKPKELDIILPLEDLENIFPQFYKMYGHSTGLKCKGDGEIASRVNDKGEFEEMECLGQKCPNYINKKCKEVATLNFLLPKVKLDGIYQLNTSSYHSIVKLNSSLDYIRSMFGRFSMIPLKLIVEGTEAHPDKKMKKIVYTLRLSFDTKKIMESIQKREELLGQVKMKKIDTPKKEIPEVALPSSDENPVDEPPIEEGEDLNPAEAIKTADETLTNNNKPQGRVIKQVSSKDEETFSLCDVCDVALTDKEIKDCGDGFKIKGTLTYQFLCIKCRKELGL